MTTEVQLPKVAQTRIARLARAAGRSPAATLRFVLRDAFNLLFGPHRHNTLQTQLVSSGGCHGLR